MPGELSKRRLTGQEMGELRDILVKAFGLGQFSDLLKTQLGIPLDEITLRTDGKGFIILDVIEWFNFRIQVAQLVSSARKSNPYDPALTEFAMRFGQATGLPNQMADTQALQLAITSVKMVDFPRWISAGALVEGQVCRISLPTVVGQMVGTGFLVGPDLVLTNYHVMKPVIDKQVLPGKVICKFDYALLNDGSPDPGTVFRLKADDWLVASTPYDERDEHGSLDGSDPPADSLDFALIRLATPAGAGNIGGEQNKATEPKLRGWLRIPEQEDDDQYGFPKDSPLVIVQHPSGAPMKLAMDTKAVIGLNTAENRVRYRVNTEPGSSGSPVFDLDWTLRALHHAGDPNFSNLKPAEYNQGIPIGKIRDYLDKRELGDLVRKKP
jgi:hypothetical protein